MSPTRKNFNINSKTVTAPLAAFTMAVLLFVYARSSIAAAKRNAQAHRDADGGQISWVRESARRHGRGLGDVGVQQKQQPRGEEAVGLEGEGKVRERARRRGRRGGGDG